MHIVIGANGLAKQALPLFKKSPTVVFFDDTENAPTWLHFHQVWNNLEYVKERVGNQPFKFSICIGAPKWRKHFSDLMVSLGGYTENQISQNSSISQVTELGKGNLILDYTLIETDAKLGYCNLINCYVGIFHDVEIGNYNEIMPGAKILGGAKIGNSCRIGSNSTILPNVQICDDVVIGAGAVVTKSITEPGTYIGVPAKKFVKIGKGMGTLNMHTESTSDDNYDQSNEPTVLD
jgi:sugar O-acyltransferase (sialic acid O-acetyltransferase NeuD family)